MTFEQRPEQNDKVNTVRPRDLGFLDQQADPCHESHRDKKEMGRKSGYRKTQMIQALGFLVSLLGSIESAQKLLEGFGARKSQAQHRSVALCPLLHLSSRWDLKPGLGSRRR